MTMFVNFSALNDISKKLKNRISSVGEIYSKVSEKSKIVDGTNEVWQGEDQKNFYEAQQQLIGEYKYNIEKLYEIEEFLNNAIETYRVEDVTFEKELDKNSENLDM